MFLLRRNAVRALSAPSKVIAKPRSIATYTPAFQLSRQQWAPSAFQRRFASDDVKPGEAAEAAAAEAAEFAQTRPEAPIEENLTPAQQNAQAPSTDASATAGVDSLEAAASSRLGGKTFSSRQTAPAPPGNTLYVGNLFYEVKEEQLQRVFSRFGTINSLKLVYDARGMSRGFAYIEYASVDDAKAAIDNLDMQVFEGRNLVVQFHRKKAPLRPTREPKPPSKTLFIGNMSFDMSDKDLNDLFRDIRNVMDVRVAIDRRTGQPRGFAHADFIDVESATKAKEVLSEKLVYGRQLRIDYSTGTNPRYQQRQQDTV